MKTTIDLTSDVVRTARVMQMEGMFDVTPTNSTHLHWDVDLPLHERSWQIGMIVGPSGSGKSTVARELWPEEYARTYTFDSKRSVLDAFPLMPIREVIELLNSVGFSSPPAWVRPFSVLSTGEQFRVWVAMALAYALHRAGEAVEAPQSNNPDERIGPHLLGCLADGPCHCPGTQLVVLDEFTSVVDRTVARVGSCAIARTVRARPGIQLVVASCHYDIEEWLQPDWVYSPATNEFEWRSFGTRPKLSSASSAFITPLGPYLDTITI